MDLWNFNTNQYDDCGCDDPLLSNKEHPLLTDGLDQESCNFSTYLSDFLIGMQNPCFDPVDQYVDWSPSDAMSFQEEYPFEELDVTLWDDNLFSNNSLYGHISADQCSTPNSNDQPLLPVSNNGLNKIEKGNETKIMSGKKNDIEHGGQGMKMPTKIRNYGHMTTDQCHIPNTMQVDQLLLSNSGLDAIEKGNGSTDQYLDWSPSDVMSFQEEYPFEELDVTLWDDNLFSNNPLYGHISADRCSTPNSNDQPLLPVSNNGLNKIEKGNETKIMSGKKNDIEHGGQGMKMPTKRRNYGHMTTDQCHIPNTMQVDQLLLSNSGLDAIEKGNGSTIMSNRKDNIEHVCQGMNLLTGVRSYGDMDQLWLGNKGLNGTEKENYGAMIMTSKKNDIEHGWQGMMLPKGLRNYGHMSAYSIHNTTDQVSKRGLIANEKINGALIISKKEGEQYGWQGKKLPTTGIRSYGHMSGANHYSIPNALDQFQESRSHLNANEKINGDMILSSKEDLHGWQGMKLPTEKNYGHIDQFSIPSTIVSNRDHNAYEKENEAMPNISKKEDVYEWQGMKVQVEARNNTVHRSQVNVESKQRLRSIKFEEMSQYFYVPIMQAARELKVGLTVLKKRCRELGINRWPHRKMKSLDSLIQNVQEMKVKGEGEGSERVDVERLIEHKRMMEKMPEMELTNETKKLRQACFKANFKKRRLMTIGPY